MQVKDVMASYARTVDPSTPLLVAARVMRDDNTGCLPVGAEDGLAGVVTDRDLVVRALADGRDGNTARVHDVMSADALCCFDDQLVEEAARLMSEHGVRRLPVLDRRNHLVGIVSLEDLSGGGPTTNPYQVAFYKTLPDSSGHPRRVVLCKVFITSAQTKEDAAAKAIERFECDHDAHPWSRLADDYEVVEPH